MQPRSGDSLTGGTIALLSSTLARIIAWSSAAGMQAFPEVAAGALVLRGKVRAECARVVRRVGGGPQFSCSICLLLVASKRRLQGRVWTQITRCAGVSNGVRRTRRARGKWRARWFSEVDVLAKDLAKFTQAEASFLAQHVPFSVLTTQVPFLFRNFSLLNSCERMCSCEIRQGYGIVISSF